MRKRFTEQQIVGVLKASAAGTKPGELCRQYGISEPTFYKWKAKYSGMEVSDLKKLKALEEENRRLKKQMVADLSLDNRALKDVLSKNF